MKIFLGPGELAVASTITALRQGVNREVGIANRKAGPQDPITTELIGILGELAVAKALNVYPDLTTHLRSGGADAIVQGYAVDVKSTRNPHGDLYVDARPGKRPDLYVLVHVEYLTCTILGWCWAAEVPDRAHIFTESMARVRHIDLDHPRYLLTLAPLT